MSKRDAKTIENIVRARAGRATRRALEAEFKAFDERHGFGLIEFAEVGLKDGGGKPVSPYYVWVTLRDAAINRLVALAADQAVVDFVDRVERLGNEVDELREELQEE